MIFGKNSLINIAMFDRTQHDMILGMQVWLRTKSLSAVERGLIEDLRDAAVAGREEFLKCYVKYMSSFSGHLASAAGKAEEEGIAKTH